MDFFPNFAQFRCAAGNILLRIDVENSETSLAFLVNKLLGQDVPVTVPCACFPAFHLCGDLHPRPSDCLMLFRDNALFGRHLLVFQNFISCFVVRHHADDHAIVQQQRLWLIFVVSIPAQIEGKEHVATIHR